MMGYSAAVEDCKRWDIVSVAPNLSTSSRWLIGKGSRYCHAACGIFHALEARPGGGLSDSMIVFLPAVVSEE